MASGVMCRTNRSDTWPHQPVLQRHPKNPCQRRAVHTWPHQPVVQRERKNPCQRSPVQTWTAALCAAQTGRTHGRTNQCCRGTQKTLANGEPSTHGRTNQWCRGNEKTLAKEAPSKHGQRRYVPHKQVGHMAAPTSVAEAPKKPLPTESRPHRVDSSHLEFRHRKTAVGATVAFRVRPQSGAHRPFMGATTKGRIGSRAVSHRSNIDS